MFKKILVANRGEIACRIMETAHRMGIQCVAVFSDADQNAKHVLMADEAWHLGPPQVSESYLQIDKIVAIARQCGAEAIHPGYGFLSENPGFVDACESAGICFIGPSASAIRDMGLKDAAKTLMENADVPVVPGYHGDNQEVGFLAAEADNIGYPVLIKARAGGGGKGMRLVEAPENFNTALESARREAESAFGDGHVLIEKFISCPRHIEVQVFGDNFGDAVHLFERDCSLQRRHQKVVEEAPAPGMTQGVRSAMGAAAVRAAKAVNYSGAGTVEFIVDGSDGLKEDGFWFMEMNTRLQVEHPVTEAITGLDLVEWQLRVASGEPLPLQQDDIQLKGHAFEARVYAEDAEKGFIPATGILDYLSFPENARIDSGVRQGDEVTPFYDPMIAKLTTHARNREEALTALNNSLADCRIDGCTTNIAFLHRLTAHKGFSAGDFDTGLIDRELEGLVSVITPEREIVAIAAMAGCGMLSICDDPDPWNRLSGWRHWSEAKQFIHLIWRDEAITCSVVSQHSGQMRVSFDDETLQLEWLDAVQDQHRIRINDHVIVIHIVQNERAVTLFRNGQTYTFSLPDQLSDDEESDASEDAVLAPMPGKIVSVSVSAGDSVAQGDALIVMEAMKMEHTLTAPRDGVVEEVTAVEGDQVTENSLLLSLEISQ